MPSDIITDVSADLVETKEERESQSLTDSLITALRDPAKPILCFVNPQIHRENARVREIAYYYRFHRPMGYEA